MPKHRKADENDFDRYFQSQAQERIAEQIVAKVVAWRKDTKAKGKTLLIALYPLAQDFIQATRRTGKVKQGA